MDRTNAAQGLSSQQVKKLQKQYGPNVLIDGRGRHAWWRMLLNLFASPLVILLLVAAGLSALFGDRASFVIITTIVFISIGLDFINSFRSQKAAEALRNKVRVQVRVIRDGAEHNVAASALVPGDIVKLVAGNVVPADGVILESNTLYANEAALTGEAFPQAKSLKAQVYMGSGIVSGSGLMQITATGRGTKFAHIAAELTSAHRPTEFESEIRQFSVLILRLTLVLVSSIFIINALLRHNILETVLFTLALAVGLTPELLPLIITLNLTKGSLAMARHGVIVKQLSAIQNFGSMDVLCTDKTGTLTEDHITLVQCVDTTGKESGDVAGLGSVSSHFNASITNPLDAAVREHHKLQEASAWHKVGEIPFDFERKCDSVIVRHGQATTLICKGAPEELLSRSTHFGLKNTKLTKVKRDQATKTFEALSADGFRVLAIATRKVGAKDHYVAADEQDLSLQGFLAFLDPAKANVGEALQNLEDLGVGIKIITGDNALVSQRIAHDIKLPIAGVLDGDQVAHMNSRELATAAETTTIFARVNPEQKMAIIRALQSSGHVVGYMGDGINDAPSLRAADVSISVNNAVDVAKDAADFIMLRKSLHELREGIIEGRKTFTNTLKYLRMSLSSNFGNMVSMAGASLFLPFLPMLATQILLNNLLYDSSQFTIPLDNVDASEIQRPHVLKISELKRFMLWYGLLSSIFDFATFAVLLWVFHASASSFRAGWFLESIATQVLVVFVVRSKLTLHEASRPAKALMASAGIVVALALFLVLGPLRQVLQFGPLKVAQVAMLALITVAYLVAAEALKRRFYGQPKAKAS